MTRLALVFACAFALATGVACRSFQAAPHPLYPGPERPLTEVARLSGPVATVDGVDVSRVGASFALLPGCHVVVLKRKLGEGSVSGAWSEEIGLVAYVFRMKAQHSYEIDVRTQPGTGGVGTANVGGIKIKAVERDAGGKAVATLEPAHKQAEIQACQDAEDAAAKSP